MGNNSLSPRKTRAIRLSEFSRLDDQQGESSWASRPQSNTYFRTQASDLHLQKKFMAAISGSFPGAHVSDRCCIASRYAYDLASPMDCADKTCLAWRRRRRIEPAKLQAGALSKQQIAVAGAAARVEIFISQASKICVHGEPRGLRRKTGRQPGAYFFSGGGTNFRAAELMQ
jgi:hypothetical protein